MSEIYINIRLGNESEIFSTYQLLNNYPQKNDGLHLYRLGNYYIKKKDYSKAIPLLLQFIKTYEAYFKDPGDFFYSQDEILLRNFYKARVHLKLAECYKKTKQETLRLQHLEHGIHYYHQGKSLPNFTIHIIGSSLFRSLEEYYQEQGERQHHYLDSAQYILDQKNKTFNYKSEPLKYEAILLHHFKGHYASDVQEKEKHYWKSYTLFKSFIGNQLKDEDQLMHFKEMKAIQNEWIDFFSTQYQNTQRLEYLTKTLEIVENLKSNILNKRSSNISNPNFEEYIQQEIVFDTNDHLKQLSPLLDQKTMDQYFEKYYEDKIFISYHLTDNTLLIISYHNGEYTLEKKKIGVSETQILSDLEDAFEKSNYFISRDFIKKLNIVGNQILPESLKHTEKKRVIISTGQALSFIPFEILRYNNEYLIEDFAVSYSFSLHHEYKDAIKRKAIISDKITTFGIAPFASSNLSYSKLEVKNICDDFLINEEANYNTTYQKIKQDHFKTLHFATHTHIDNIPQKSFIKLSPNTGMSDKITFDDIQKLHLSNLELVTLSTCQSANGKYMDGEGSLSLQRAFAYAQIPSIVAGKWNVNDQASSAIMSQFYIYLKEGWDKDIALQKAKLDLLSEKEYLYNNPMFWGSLILTGNTNPITSPSLKVQFLKTLSLY
ncbi:CHAT domain-containing protein [Flammeovirga aprica]|uniref:CHAT domain-containing protein n=1 Tax=Flammeovirga aprica JL-4 TaxID=694437 RepID=A0A7X9RW19_9BACT|nr:CHAT domain-containing protein [Flammeovirga aprica]NME69765.1 CHAT domain-containing protein [Flammeovirga aprica JL-4]